MDKLKIGDADETHRQIQSVKRMLAEERRRTGFNDAAIKEYCSSHFRLKFENLGLIQLKFLLNHLKALPSKGLDNSQNLNPADAFGALSSMDSIKRELLDERWRTGHTVASNEQLCLKLFKCGYDSLCIAQLNFLRTHYQSLPSATA
jgi:hypothetical protein